MKKHHVLGSKTFSAVLAASLVMSPLAAQAERIVQLSPLVPANTVASPYAAMPATIDERVELRGRISAIPKGTLLLVKLDQPVSSFSNNVGDSVSGTLDSDIFVNDYVAIPAGSEAIGQITNVSRSGKMGKHGEIEIRFFSVKTPDGQMVPIQAHVITKDNSGVLRGNSYGTDVLKGIGYAAGGTGVGAVLGTATGGLLGVAGAGAVFGTAVGGIAGITYALTRTGKDVVLPAGSRVSLMMDQEAKVN